MNLRQKLLLLALVALVLPLSSWLLLRELEDFLRAGQQHSLKATANTIARSLQSELAPLSRVGNTDLLLSKGGDIAIDGYFTNWPQAAAYWREFKSTDGLLTLKLAGRTDGSYLWLGMKISDQSAVRENLAVDGAMDGLEISLFGPQGMTSFTIAAAATGPLTLSSKQHRQMSGYWLDRQDGYRIELKLPLKMASAGIKLRLVDVDDPGVRLIAREITPQRLQLAPPLVQVSQQLQTLLGPGQSAWLLDANGNIRSRARGGPQNMQAEDQQRTNTAKQATWVARSFHNLFAKNLPVNIPLPATSGRLPAGFISSGWSRKADNAAMVNAVTVAIPLAGSNKTVATLQLQALADDLLLLSNQTLLRIVGISVLAMLVIMLAMYLFAGRLSARVRKLNLAVNLARENPHQDANLPLLDDKDELGELARTDAGLLQAVQEYNQYLQTLSSKLSHELKTPLVIVRSSLENLSREVKAPQAHTYLSRAQEGSDRLGGILRAMSDASRLEQSISLADKESFDLAAMLKQSAAAYAQIYPGHQISSHLPQPQYDFYGAPELLAQALDKLVDNAVSLTRADDEIILGYTLTKDGVTLFVRNSGSSLPAEMRDQLFESLVSLRGGNHQGIPHLGLGLYLVKLIAEAHQGQASASNLPDNAGVVFKLTLPLLKP